MLLGTEISSNNTRVMVTLLRGFTSVYMLIREAFKKKSFTVGGVGGGGCVLIDSNSRLCGWGAS